MATKRMTANPVKPARYRPGKPLEEEASEEDYGSEEEHAQQPQNAPAPPPKALSFPSGATRITRNLKDVDLNERKRQAAAEEAARIKAEEVERVGEEEGFETDESDDESSEEEQDSEDTSEAEESSSEDEAPKPLLRPTFIKKDKRNEASQLQNKEDDQIRAEKAAMKRERADAMIQEQLEKDAAARALGMKDWDDNENQDIEQVDDTDGLDPEMERAAWKLRELKRVKRDRETIEAAEKEREEIERRRNLSKEAREAEDAEFLEQQKAQKDGKGKMGYMQKYYHKGAFFQDDAKAEGLDQRDIMGSRYQDDALNRELLPQFMQIRDMTKLGRKGRTKYKDLKTEDTGQWGQYQDKYPHFDQIKIKEGKGLPELIRQLLDKGGRQKVLRYVWIVKHLQTAVTGSVREFTRPHAENKIEISTTTTKEMTTRVLIQGQGHRSASTDSGDRLTHAQDHLQEKVTTNDQDGRSQGQNRNLHRHIEPDSTMTEENAVLHTMITMPLASGGGLM
ncbi:MAG: hypothetical protein Q9214_005151 [Letrouitia sp. 1 TL-2023]